MTLDLTLIFLDKTAKAQVMKKKKQTNWTSSKWKIFCALKDTINRVKMQPKEWEKTFANYISYKALIYKVYKKLLKLRDKKNQPD